MVAGTISSPVPGAIHRLRATRGRALLVVVAVWASDTVVSSVGSDLVKPAPPVLVVRGVVLARPIRSPRTNTVHGLRATRLSALLEVVAKRTAVSIMSSILANLVVPAPLVGVSSLKSPVWQLESHSQR